MANLSDAAQALGQADQFVGFVQRSGHRLFNENVYSRFHHCARNLKMLESGNRDRGSLNFAVRGSELLDGSETATTELAATASARPRSASTTPTRRTVSPC